MASMECSHDWKNEYPWKKYCDEQGCSFIQILEHGEWHSMDEMPKCPDCKAYLTWLGPAPGVECRPCGNRWTLALPSMKLYPLPKLSPEIQKDAD